MCTHGSKVKAWEGNYYLTTDKDRIGPQPEPETIRRYTKGKQ